MAHDLEPGWKLARHRGGFLEGPTGSSRARQEGLSGVVHGQLDEEHAARQAHGRARLSFSEGGPRVHAPCEARTEQGARPRVQRLFRASPGRGGCGIGGGAGPSPAFRGAEEFAPPRRSGRRCGAR
jgi:hypothetical protein